MQFELFYNLPTVPQTVSSFVTGWPSVSIMGLTGICGHVFWVHFRTGWPGVSILVLGELSSLINNFSVVALSLLDAMRHFCGFAGLPRCATRVALTHVPLPALQMQMRELYDQSEYLL